MGDHGRVVPVFQSSLPGFILSRKNSHTHAGSASNCTFSTKQGTGLDEIIQQNPQWYWCSFMRGILNVLLQAEIFEHTKLLTINFHGQVNFIEMSCLDHDPLWRMASPKQVACRVQFSADPACVWLFLLLRMKPGRELCMRYDSSCDSLQCKES